MSKIKNVMSRDDKDEIFGVKEVSGFSTNGLELRYKVESGQEGEDNYLMQRVYRDKNGNYFFAAKGGANATIGLETSYPLNGWEVLIPIRPEALAVWGQNSLCGEECKRALEEFEIPKAINHKTIWLHQQGLIAGQENYVFEFLRKTDSGFYMLLSTECDYPCFGYHIPFTNHLYGIRNDYLFTYFIAPETARRWAEARGMAEADCQRVFGD